MPDRVLRILLDQNIPRPVAAWLRGECPGWTVEHVYELGFGGKPDEFLYQWAREHGAVIVTYDEDFADARFYPLGEHAGIVRLRVWPTTTEKTQEALARMIESIQPSELRGALVIIGDSRIRLRMRRSSTQS